MIDKTYRTEFSRLFLIESLPEPLTRASAHLQIFDNYVIGTRLRIRSVRDPETKLWTRLLQQRFPVGPDLSEWKTAEMHLNDGEYARLEAFEGVEVRKNRYFHDLDSRTVEFDVYLGNLWGLNRAKVKFETRDELNAFQPPSFAVIDVTGNRFFADENLVMKTFGDIQAEVARSNETDLPDAPDE